MRKRTSSAVPLSAIVVLGAAIAQLVVAAQDRPNEITLSRREYDMGPLLAPSPLSAVALKGRTIWLQRCAFCHDGVGQPTYQTIGPWLDSSTVQSMGDAPVREKIATGSAGMPGFQYNLRAEQVDALLAFLRTVTPDQRPTADQLARVPPRVSTAPPRAPGTAGVAAPAPSAMLMGTVRAADGKLLDGVTVSARARNQTFTTSVYTDTRGEYVFPALPIGAYQVWAQAVGFATARAERTLDGTRSKPEGLTLQPVADFTPQLTGVEWYDALPEDTPDHRRMKQVLRVSCSDCHSLGFVLQNRFDEQGWRTIVKAMEEAAPNGWTGRIDPPDEQLGLFGPNIRHYRDELATYLASMRGPGPSPMTFKPLPRPSGDAARAVVTEFDVPIGERPDELAWHAGSDWSDGPAGGMHGAVGPHDVLIDRDGNAWIAENRVSFETDRTLVKVDVKTGQSTGFAFVGPDGRVLFTEQMTVEPSGTMWFHMGANILTRLDPIAETFATFTPARGMGNFSNSTDWDSRGRIWKNGRYGSVRFDPATKKFQMFQQNTPGNGFTYGVAADADDNGWWSEFTADIVAKADNKTGKVQEVLMRGPGYDARKKLFTPEDLDFFESIGAQTWNPTFNVVPWGNAPRRLSADKAGNTVWVPNWAGQFLAEIDIHTLKVTYHPMPIHGNPYNTHVDKQHNVWTDVQMADSLLRLNPTTQEWTVFKIPSIGCNSRHFTIDDVRGEVWVPCIQTSRIARFQLRTAQQIEAQKAAASAR